MHTKINDNYQLHNTGILKSVSNLTKNETDSMILLEWKHPFSLNLSTIEPDIAYCIDVYRYVTTGNETFMISSSCDVLDERFTFRDKNPDPTNLFLFVVIPKSNVEGARNGTASQIIGQFLPQSKPY